MCAWLKFIVPPLARPLGLVRTAMGSRAPGICWNYSKSGTCHRGRYCKFIHDDARMPREWTNLADGEVYRPPLGDGGPIIQEVARHPSILVMDPTQQLSLIHI